jgi:hypothetical protein
MNNDLHDFEQFMKQRELLAAAFHFTWAAFVLERATQQAVQPDAPSTYLSSAVRARRLTAALGIGKS